MSEQNQKTNGVNLDEEAEYKSHMRVPTIFGTISMVVSAGAIGFVAERWLHQQGITTEGLGTYVTIGIVAVALNALVRLHAIIGWIAYIDHPDEKPYGDMTVLDTIAKLEDATEGSMRTFGPILKATAVTLLAIAYLINTNEPEIAASLVLPWVRDYPLAAGAAAAGIGSALGNVRTVWYFVGDGPIKTACLWFGKIRLGYLVGGFGGFALVTAICSPDLPTTDPMPDQGPTSTPTMVMRTPPPEQQSTPTPTIVIVTPPPNQQPTPTPTIVMVTPPPDLRPTTTPAVSRPTLTPDLRPSDTSPIATFTPAGLDIPEP